MTWLGYWIFLGAALLAILLARKWLLKRAPSETASMASIMASGIFINGALAQFPLLARFGGLLSITLFAAWVWIAHSYVLSWMKGTFRAQHTDHPIKTFAMGTWVAGSSVCAAALVRQVPEWSALAAAVALVGLAVWLVYVALCLANYAKIIRRGLLPQVHGVLLILTVSTQSLVVVGETLLGPSLPDAISASLIGLGVLFYLFGFILIARRYLAVGRWKVADDWQNTNCIIHGAMSITGLASVLSGAVSGGIVLAIWLWVLSWFVIVESIELWRIFARTGKYGLIGAIGVYHVTQWSRNFTFGMLYAFTLNLDLAKTPFGDSLWLNQAQASVLTVGKWVVLLFLLYEIVLFVRTQNAFAAVSEQRKLRRAHYGANGTSL